MRLYFVILLVSLSLACEKKTETPRSNMNNAASNQNAAVARTTPQTSVPVYTYEIVNSYNHDSDSFTQGLFFQNGFLYESAGGDGKSDLRKVDLKTGDVKQRRKMESKYFGEGATVLNNKIYQLTWQDGKCFVYDLNTFEPLFTLAYNGEGWGLTNDGTNLIMSDGSHQIKFLDPENFRVIRTINVFNNGKALTNLNELEYVKSEIWANIWHSDEENILGKENYIARINPADGKILGWIDLKGISPDDVTRDEENTLNGIAYDAATDRIFVTGKRWRRLFEIKIAPKS